MKLQKELVYLDQLYIIITKDIGKYNCFGNFKKNCLFQLFFILNKPKTRISEHGFQTPFVH